MRAYRNFPSLVLVTLVFSSVLGRAEATTFRSVADLRSGQVVWIHRRPDTASPRVGYLKAGALQVRTLGCKRLAEGGWCHVMRRGTNGWVQDRFLKDDNVLRG